MAEPTLEINFEHREPRLYQRYGRGESLQDAGIPVINMAALALYSLNDCPVDTEFQFTQPARLNRVI